MNLAPLCRGMERVRMLLAQRLNPEEMPEKFCRLLAVHLGGRRTVDMLTEFHVENRSQEEIALRFEVSQGNVSRRLAGARAKLKHLGLFPPAWEARMEPAEIEP
jgi:hypothetical protein